MPLPPRKKEVWSGIRRSGDLSSSVVGDTFDRLRRVTDYGSFSSEVSGMGEYYDLDQYLVDKGFSENLRGSFINRTQSSFDSFSDFQSAVSSASSFGELSDQYGTQTSLTGGEPGGTQGGIRVFESAGTTHEGVPAEAGDVEVFGGNVYLSEGGGGGSGGGGGGGGDTSPDFSLSNLDASPSTVTELQGVSISADLTNNGAPGRTTVSLIINDRQEDTQTKQVDSGQTVTVTFTWAFPRSGTYSVRIDDLSPVTVEVQPD